jgi:hypothetical protein
MARPKKLKPDYCPDKAYWRVTLNHPPVNIFGPDTIPQLDEMITAIESDADIKRAPAAVSATVCAAAMH